MVEISDSAQATDESQKIIEFKQYKDRIENVIDDAVNEMFMNRKYETSSMQKLVNQCSEQIIKNCQQKIGEDEMKDIKLVAETIILQKGSVGFHMGGATYWET